MKHTKYLFIALIISVGLVSFQSTAQAISAAQFDCEYSCFQVPGDNIWHADPALSVTFKNPKLEKNVILLLSAETASENGEFIVLSYNIDGIGCGQSVGAEYLSHNVALNVSTHMGIAPALPGSHTFVPCYATTSPNAVICYRCITAEGRTN